jgi:hypothetical protein
MTVVLKNPLRTKQLQQGLAQLGEEGAIQVFRPKIGGPMLLGAVGQLQFEVVQHRLKAEYDCDVRLEGCQYTGARWITADTPAELKRLHRRVSAADGAGRGQCAGLLVHFAVRRAAGAGRASPRSTSTCCASTPVGGHEPAQRRDAEGCRFDARRAADEFEELGGATRKRTLRYRVRFLIG